MANHKSAIKQHRQSIKRRAVNRRNRSRLRTAVKKFTSALERGEAAAAAGLLPLTLSIVDRSAKLGAIHHRTASRAKSRLTRALNRLPAGA